MVTAPALHTTINSLQQFHGRGKVVMRGLKLYPPSHPPSDKDGP